MPDAPAPPVQVDPNQPVAVVSSSGKVGTLPYSKAQEYLRSGDVRAATAEEWASKQAADEKKQSLADYQARHGGAVSSGLQAASLGALSSLTFGLSDKALVEAGRLTGGDTEAQSVADELKLARENNPYSTLAGEAVGLALPALATGGASAAGKGLVGAATAPVRAVTAAGEAAATGVGRLVGTGATSVAGRMAQGAARAAARGVVEGAAFGAGRAVSESAIQNQDLTAEKLYAGMGEGALAGGAVGGIVGAAGPALSAGWKGVKGAVASAAGAEGKSVRQVIEDYANVKAFKAAGGQYAKGMQAAEAVEGGAARVGRDVLKEVEAETGKNYARLSESDIAKAIEKRRELRGAELGAVRQELDKWAEKTGIRPDVDAYADRVKREVLEPLAGISGTRPTIRTVLNHLEEMKYNAALADGESSFTRMQQELNQLSKLAKFDASKSNEVRDAYRAMRGILNDELEKAGDQAAQAVGDTGFLARYKQAKSLTQSLIVADDAIQAQVSKHAANRSMSLSDYLATGAGLASGGGVGALAAGFANKVLRERGDAIIAGSLNKILKLGQVQMAEQAFDAEVKKSVAAFFRSEAAAKNVKPASTTYIKPAKGETRVQAVAKAIDDIAKNVTNPSRLADQVAPQIGQLAADAPELAAKVTQQAVKVNDFLATKIPPNFQPQGLQAHIMKPRISESDAAKFARYLTAAKYPQTVLQDFRNGVLTREAVEAVKSTSPQLFKQIQTEAMNQLAEQKSQLPYKKRIQIQLLLEMPVDRSMNPAFIRSVQETYQQQNQQPQQETVAGGPGRTSKAGPNALVQQSMTADQKLEQGM